MTVDDPLVRRVNVLIAETPDLAEAAQMYQAVLSLLRDADLRVGPVSMTQDQVRAKMADGLPLLVDLDLELDEHSAHALMVQLARALEAIDLQFSGAARQIRLSLEEGGLDTGTLLPHVISGDRAAVETIAHDLQIQPDLLWKLANHAVAPALRAWAQQLGPLADGGTWNKAYCFICGAGALLGELQGDNQSKHVRCGHCGADWLSRRLKCLHCGNEEHTTLGCLYAEETMSKTRVEVCDVCKGYLKVINAYAPTAPEMLLLEDLATLHLDAVARERGYFRG